MLHSLFVGISHFPWSYIHLHNITIVASKQGFSKTLQELDPLLHFCYSLNPLLSFVYQTSMHLVLYFLKGFLLLSVQTCQLVSVLVIQFFYMYSFYRFLVFSGFVKSSTFLSLASLFFRITLIQEHFLSCHFIQIPNITRLSVCHFFFEFFANHIPSTFSVSLLSLLCSLLFRSLFWIDIFPFPSVIYFLQHFLCHAWFLRLHLVFKSQSCSLTLNHKLFQFFPLFISLDPIYFLSFSFSIFFNFTDSAI